MEKLDYFVTFDDLAEIQLGQLEAVLIKANKKRVGSVTIEELCSVIEYPNGLYLLFDNENTLLYVGKATSRSFIERIPAHFDTREDAWFNTIPKRIMSILGLQSYHSALQKGLSFQIVLIGVKDKAVTFKLETVLRSYLKPKLNSCKGDYAPETKLGTITNYGKTSL